MADIKLSATADGGEFDASTDYIITVRNGNSVVRTVRNAPTFSGKTTLSGTGSASNAVLSVTGAPLTGGTATTNFPHVFLQPTGATAVTTWSTNGTFIGVNAASGFSGRFVDFRLNGASSGGAAFRVDHNGNTYIGGAVTTGSSIESSGNIATSASSGFRNNAAAATLTATTSGSMKHSQPFQGTSYKKFIAASLAYVNNSAVNQTITFPVAFANAPSVIFNDTGLTVSASTTTLTITAPNNATAYSGNIVVEGI